VIGNGWTATGTDFGSDPVTYPNSGPWYINDNDNYSPDMDNPGDVFDGTYYFCAGVTRVAGATGELFQDINVSNYTGPTGAILVSFTLDGALATGGNGDDAEVIVEWRDGSGTVLSVGYDSHADLSVGPDPNAAWHGLNNTLTSVAGTRIIRIRLIATNSSPSGPIHAFFDGLTFSTFATPLPINLLSFQGLQKPDHTVSLLWQTAQEENSSYIEVQRSADGKSFSTIGKVPAAGNSNTVRDYSFIDGSPLAGNGSYRLRLVDLDGKSRYSRAVVVNSDASGGRELELLGNPFHDHIGLRVALGSPDQLTLTLMDVQGRVYLRQANRVQPGANFIDVWPPTGIAGGIYLLNVRGAFINQTIRVLKQ
jgi:hypothetical protein